MTLSQIIDNQDFLKVVVRTTDFKDRIENCSKLQLQCIIEIIINIDQLSKDSTESEIVDSCRELINYFKKRNQLSEPEIRKLFINHEAQVKELISVFLCIAFYEAMLVALDTPDYDDL